jgi:[ribosomal protein S5]-alanine N-acetyltransferase
MIDDIIFLDRDVFILINRYIGRVILLQKIYETERLLLKLLDQSYAGLVVDYYLRNKSFLDEWEPLQNEEFYTKQHQEEQLNKELSNIENKSSFRLWVFKKEDESRIIGSVGFNNIVRGAFLSCHLGYKLDKEEINKGFISEAIQKGIEIMFNEFGLHRIEANIMPKNKRSFRVVEKLGFYNEGLAYKYLKINGKWEDHIHMVLLNDMV